MIRALIADDEALSRRALHQMLERHPDVEIVAECHDGAEARDAIVRLSPDVAFLDIRMPLETGLDLARTRADPHRTLVVFVTAFDQFALPAFAANAADYLTKPLTETRFDEALDRLRARVQLRRDAERAAAADEMPRASTFARHLVARVGMQDVVIPLDSIEYIEAEDVYAAVVARNKRQLVRMPLDALEHVLDPSCFVRVHRSYIVRIDRVVTLRRLPNGGAELALTTGVNLPVSRRRRSRVSRLFAGK